jgi:predicted ArsR family transcriptional regulator
MSCKARVLDTIRTRPSTCDDIERLLGLSHQTASARINELVREHEIIDSGARRPTKSGRKARVYKALEEV